MPEHAVEPANQGVFQADAQLLQHLQNILTQVDEIPDLVVKTPSCHVSVQIAHAYGLYGPP